MEKIGKSTLTWVVPICDSFKSTDDSPVQENALSSFLKASNGAHLIFCACVHQNVLILIYNVLWQVLIAFIYVMNSIFEICTHWFGQHVYVLMKKCLTSTLFWKIFWLFDTETIEWSLHAMNLMLENCHARTNYVPFSLNPSYFYSD